MSRSWPGAVLAGVLSLTVFGADWPMPGGSPQRNGWARSERVIDKANVATLKALYKYRTDTPAAGLNTLTPPVINGNLITFRGFKEMLMFGASSDRVFSVDADLNQLLWQASLTSQTDQAPPSNSTAVCPGGLTAPIAMAGSSSSAMHFTMEASRLPPATGVRPRHPSPYFPPLWQSVYPMTPNTLTQLAALYAISSDGRLHVLNSSTGADLITPIKFVPPHARVTSINIWENVVYATTADNCDGYQNAVYAVDLLSNEKRVALFVPERGGFSGLGGTAIGNNGNVYVQALYKTSAAKDTYRESVLALNPKTLQVRDYFTPADERANKASDALSVTQPGITPMAFSWFGRDAVIAGGQNGRLYLLDARSLGGADHHTPMLESQPIAQREKHHNGWGFRGTFSTWRDVDTETRWIYAPVAGPLDRSAELTDKDSGPVNGSVVALKLTQSAEQPVGGQTATSPVLQPVWVSRDLLAPAPVVIANGMIFALATGESSRTAKKNGAPYSGSEWNAMASPATLFAFDSTNGKELFSTGNTIPTYSHSPGLAVANGRVYFSTHDNTMYCYGLPEKQPQLREQ